MAIRFRVSVPGAPEYGRWRRKNLADVVRAGKVTADTISTIARDNIRSRMRASGMGGRFVYYVGSGSDLKKRRSNIGPGGLPRMSAWVFTRSPSKPSADQIRGAGTFKAYTDGATMRSRRGTWLAYPTRNLPRYAGRNRVTVGNYAAKGLDQRFGPLVFKKISSRIAIWFVKTKESAVPGIRGGKRTPFGKSKFSRISGNDGIKVMFIGIKVTGRKSRFRPVDIVRDEMSRFPKLFAAHLIAGRRRSLTVTPDGNITQRR